VRPRTAQGTAAEVAPLPTALTLRCEGRWPSLIMPVLADLAAGRPAPGNGFHEAGGPAASWWTSRPRTSPPWPTG
jgi:hypothetical protein